MAVITGNTYPVKDQLKALGGRWDGASRGWIVPESRAEEARQLVASAPVKAAKSGYTPRAPRVCKDCGQRINYGVYCGKCEFSR